MMELRFDVSAGDLKFPHEKQCIREEPKEETVIVTLAPFTAHAKLCFENVTVGTVVVQKVIVENPSTQDMKVQVKSLPPSKRNVSVNWEACIINAKDSVLFEVTWSPNDVDSWRHSLTFQFGRCLNKDLPISFKSVAKTKNNKKVIKEKKKSPKRQPKIINPYKQTTTKTKPIMKTIPHTEKENVVPVKNCFPKITFSNLNEIFHPSSNTNFVMKTANYDDRRYTYTVNECITDFYNMSEDSLEISSPDNKYLHESTSLVNTNDLISLTSREPFSKLTSFSECNLKNISSGTYVKGNISSETYVKGNISTETYVKNNISPDTYIKDSTCGSSYIKEVPTSPIIIKNRTWTSRKSSSMFLENAENLDENHINLSPILKSNIHQQDLTGIKARDIIEANLWETETLNEECEHQKAGLKRKSDITFDSSPPKRAHIDETKVNFYNKNVDWNKTVKLQKNYFIGTSYFDPFMSEFIYNNEEWMEKQEMIFKNWLNALLTPPLELESNVDGQPINVAKLWQDCKQKIIPAVPTKENISNKYHINHRLESLRKSARSLFQSNEVSNILTKTISCIESKKLLIREDKNVHLDLNLQSNIMALLLCYNPLWLRIGLETIYNTRIVLNSNSDLVGLNNFIMQNFFRSSSLFQKYKTIHSPKYATAIKTFVLKKFFALVYFLDIAKCKVLIGHDPCLFRKNAPIKDSREILLTFSRELLSSVGDITKILRFYGYIVNHKQSYIEEFNYSVIHLGVDLRDGVRLTKVMEIILMQHDLIMALRVPPVSRLQKIHNMKIVFKALLDADFQIIGDIQPKDIVDGHHEKTLSFLWQIVYKFQTPLMVHSATRIQKWWRSLVIVLKRKRIAKKRKLVLSATIKIQKWYRQMCLARKLLELAPKIRALQRHLLLTIAAIKIQSYFKMYKQRKVYALLIKSIIRFQSHIRSYLLRRTLKHKLQCIVSIQAFIRMWLNRREFLRVRASVIYIQQVYRGRQLMLIQKVQYEKIKATTLWIQKRYRANQIMKVERKRYHFMKVAVLTIQLYFRSYQLMKMERRSFLKIKYATIVLQKYIRAFWLMKRECTYYKSLRYSAIVIQRRLRANQLMKMERKKFTLLKEAAIVIQKQFKANHLMKVKRTMFTMLKRAAIVVQRRFRANQLMKVECKTFMLLREAVIITQRRFKANKLMKRECKKFMFLRAAAIITQRRFRANQLMKVECKKFSLLKRATIAVQRQFRANQLMKVQSKKYILLREAAIIMQRQFRANQLMKMVCKKFMLLREAAIITQRRFRANQLRKVKRKEFALLKRVTIAVQMRFKANQLMKVERKKFMLLRDVTIVVQRRFKANQLMKIEYEKFTLLKKAAIVTKGGSE
ncbi:hypothetical protein FQA39_LY02429 [Lamprigera yunnana]|nr:hypothetical protein FQA39_LY02429 [Lamprigera yunnana]